MEATRTIPALGVLAAVDCAPHENLTWLLWLWHSAHRFGWPHSFGETADRWRAECLADPNTSGDGLRTVLEAWLCQSGLSAGQANELAYAAESRLRCMLGEGVGEQHSPSIAFPAERQRLPSAA